MQGFIRVPKEFEEWIIEMANPTGTSSVAAEDTTIRYWVLVGHWEGTPFPIMRGEDVPPFSVWSVTDKEQWERLRSEKYYTRRSKSRPVAKVDREFQRQTEKDVWEE